MRDATTYNLVLGTNQGEIIVLASIFEYGDGFKGATGDILDPVSQLALDEALTHENKCEWYEDVWSEIRRNDESMPSLDKWVDTINDDEYLESRYETYTDVPTADIAKALGEDEPARYALVGVGRIFPRVLDGIELIDSDEVRAAVELIRAIES